ncbi:MAG: AsnC family transcriptional regulator [Hylemonella sp.]|nr:AsnC family transcriptional regulator [Hylemonella sp.]
MSRAELSAGDVQLDPVDARLIDRLHDNFPLTERPFADVGRELGLDEETVLERLRTLLSQGTLTRFGPMFQIERAGGEFVLAALEVPEADFARVAQIVNEMPEVAHNYRRAHRMNMWFVVAASSSEEVQAALRSIRERTGLQVHAFPKEREYFVGLRLRAGNEDTGHDAR